VVEIGLFLGMEELTGTKTTVSDVNEVLRPFRRKEVLVFLAQLTAITRTWWQNPDLDIEVRLCNDLLPNFVEVIKRYRSSGPVRIVFNRLGILLCARQCVLVGDDSGAPINGIDDLRTIATAVLLANDLLSGPEEGVETTTESVSRLIPFADYGPIGDLRTEVARALTMFGDIASSPTVAKRISRPGH
jgi:hypothetical protein